MTEVDHISAAWVERKLLDALDQIEGRVDGVEDKLTDVELGVRAVVKARSEQRGDRGGLRKDQRACGRD